MSAGPGARGGTASPPLRRLLIANRGEIACRIQDTAERLGVESIVVYSDADSGARHVRRARRAVRLGPGPVAESYLRGSAIVEIARETGAQAVHPGYGLLSESPEFAAACEAAGVAFVGPTPAQIEQFGHKDRARELAEKAGVPVCPGSGRLEQPEDAVEAARAVGFPLLIKAVAGGGGIGMRLCREPGALPELARRVAREAQAGFGLGALFVERFVERARHVEVQIFGDGEGGAVALGERDCSLQRRRQKVFEESPAPGLDAALRAELARAARELAESVRYRSAGTVEFLVDPRSGEFFFLEVNTRLQVEHGVTEAVTGVDLVEWMIRLAAGDASFLNASPPEPRGHAVEVRLYAEDPGRDFAPQSGLLGEVAFPADVRVDGWVESGTEVTPFYDPLLAKLIARGQTRAEALAALHRALVATRLGGIATNLEYARALARWPEFAEGRHHTRSLESFDFAPAALRVETAGTADSVQDAPGRVGYWAVGVPPSGAMDPLALRLANRIVGNVAGLAALEIAVSGPTLRFERDAIVCLAGAPAAAELDGRALPMWRAVAVSRGARLRIGELGAPGARCALAVRGGIAVPEYLGSRASFDLGRFGGHCGRNLVAGDLLPLGDAGDVALAPDPPLPDADAARWALAYPSGGEWELRVLEGPHASPEFTTWDDRERFFSEPFEVHYQSARTGVRLIGPRPRWAREDGGEAGLHPSNIHDTPYALGSVDYTGDMPVILGPDGPSLGGFVCPAVVVRADLWKLGQLRAGDRVRFRAVEAREADRLAEQQSRALARREPLPADAVASAPAPSPVPRPSPSGGGRPVGVLWSREPCEGRPACVIRQAGDANLLVELGPMTLDLDLRVRVQLLYEALRERAAKGGLPGIVDLTPGVRSLQLHFDPDRVSRQRVLDVALECESALPEGEAFSLPSRIVHLPLSWEDPQALRAVERYQQVVRDDAPWCPSNVEFIRRINGLRSVEDVQRIVLDASYLVLGLGDVYLGAPLATPLDPRHRLVTTKYNPARTWTPENAVGIGGAYLCVYGMEGPGGYQLFGRTVPVWSTYGRWKGAAAGEPWLLRFFDQIRFHLVSPEELLEQREALREGRSELRIEASRFDLAEHHRFLDEHADEIERFRTAQRAAFRAERERWVASGELEAAQRLSAAVAPPSASAEEALPEGCLPVTAPLGAQVVAVSAQPGQRVREGEALAQLSAMKTETAVCAQCGGVIEQVLCAEGQVVSPGAPLFALRPDPGAA